MTLSQVVRCIIAIYQKRRVALADRPIGRLMSFRGPPRNLPRPLGGPRGDTLQHSVVQSPDRVSGQAIQLLQNVSCFATQQGDVAFTVDPR